MAGWSPFQEWLGRQSAEQLDQAVAHKAAVKYPHRPVFVVDWDGVCVHEFNPHTGRPWWPGMGPWMDGAIEGLRRLSEIGLTTIFTLRVSPLSPDCETARHPLTVEEDYEEIRRMLDDQGLFLVTIWTAPGKPPGQVYIDDRGWRHNSWNHTLSRVESGDILSKDPH